MKKKIAISIITILLPAVILVVGMFLVFLYGLEGKLLIIVSDSMQPSLRRGDLILVKPFNEYSVGDVITFKPLGYSNNLITHRISKIVESNGHVFYITKGDANNTDDPWQMLRKEIKGKVKFVVPRFSTFFHPLALCLFFYAPVGLLVGRIVKNIVLSSNYE